MAVQLVSSIAPALSFTLDNVIARQWNRMARTISLLKAKPGNGKSVNWDISTSGQTATAYTEGADITAGELLVDAKLPMILPWAFYRNALGLSDHSISVAMQSRGSAEELMNLLEESVYEAVCALAAKLNQDLFAGIGSANQFCGFDYSLLATGTYAGQSVTGTLVSNVDANGTVPRALTLDLMNKMEAAIFVASGKRPDLIVTTPAVMNKYKSLFEPIRRLVGDSVNRYDTGVQDDQVYFMGIPVIRDKDCPAGKMYFLNLSTVSMHYSPPVNTGDSVIHYTRSGMGSNGAGDTQEFGLPFSVVGLAKTGDSTKLFINTVAQLAVRQPNANGLISYITE